MKKLLYAFMALFLLGAGVTACGDDDDDDTVFATPAEKDAEGSFSGTFVRVQVGTTDTLTATGTLILSATDTANRAKVCFVCDTIFIQIEENPEQVTTDSIVVEKPEQVTTDSIVVVMPELVITDSIPVNIAHADQGFMFYNKLGDYAVVGRIDANRDIRTTFTKAVRSGRSTRRYNYEFIGTRQ